jgi:Outer membrane protein beta-barrel domain
VNSHKLRHRHGLEGRCVWCVSSFVLGACASAKAQQIFVPPSDTYGKPQSVEQAMESRIGSIAAPTILAPTGQRVYPLHWGKVQLFPYMSYLLQYGSEVPNGGITPANTFLNTLAPGMICTWGEDWAFDFSLNANFYSNPDFRNYVGYSFAIRNSAKTEEWLWSYGASASLSDQNQVETATQTFEQDYSVSVSGTYGYSARVSLEVGLNTTARLTDEFSSYWSWNTSEWLNYKSTPKTTLGIGLGAGYNLVDPGPNTIFEQLQGRVIWSPGPKLSFQLSGGVQFQQITDGSSGNHLFPLGAVSVAYQVRDGTSLSLNASTSIANSYYTGQINQNSSFSFGIQQRLFKHFSLSVTPGYQFTQYHSTTADFQDSGDQSSFFLYAGLSTVLFKKLNTSLFYQLNDSSSSDATLDYDTWQVGVRVNYRY